MDALFSEICLIMVVEGLFRMAWIGLLDDETNEVVPTAWAGVDEGYLEQQKINVLDEKQKNGPIVSAISEGRYNICNDIANDGRSALWREGALERGYHSSMSLPIRVNQKVKGVFTVYAGEIYFFNKDEIYLLTTLVEDLSYALGFIEEELFRSKVEQDLRLSETKHRTLFETMTQGVVYQDANGFIFSANPAAEKILGLTLDQMQGRNSLDPRWKTVHEDGSDFPGNEHPAYQALKTGEPVMNKLMGVWDSSTHCYRWVNVNSVPQFLEGQDKPYQVYSIFEDVTSRIQVEKKLRASEQKFRDVIEQSVDGISLTDEEGTLIEWNRGNGNNDRSKAGSGAWK